MHVKGKTHAVTVTKNIVGPHWTFSIHVWDDTGPVPIQGFPLPDVFNRNGQELPLPWDLYAKTVGNRVTFKASARDRARARLRRPHPRSNSGATAGMGIPGNNGWYIGHLLPGDTARFAGLHVRP